LGYNGAAYQLAARNSLRWGEVFPVQYVTGDRKPTPRDLYTHAPLALHAHTTAGVWLLGDTPSSVRLVCAVMGWLSALALWWAGRRLWGQGVALVALALYVAMPINGIYINMTNHSTGLFAASLVAMVCLVERMRALGGRVEGREGAGPPGPGWTWGFFGASFVAMQWDWPAYYGCAFAALWWGGRVLALARARGFREARREASLWVAFCAMVLASFAGYFVWAGVEAGGFEEMRTSFGVRNHAPPNAWKTLWEGTFLKMYPAPVLWLGAAWALGWVARLVKGRAQGRDLIPLSWLLAGVLHTVLFPSSGIIHAYWVWPFLPGLALGGAEVLVAAGVGLGQGLAWLAGQGAARPWKAKAQGAARAASVWALLAVVWVWFAPSQARWLVEGRRTGGWLYSFPYSDDLDKVAFGRWVHARTGPHDQVLVHAPMGFTVEFTSALDRVFVKGAKLPKEGLRQGPRGEVAVGLWARLPVAQRDALAAKHPFVVVGRFFFVDYRRQGQAIEVWRPQERELGPAERFLGAPFAPSWELVRDGEAERRLRRAVFVSKSGLK
jgi:hypothetical protein